MPTYIVNRKAYRDYEILEKIEAGIKLQGSEVKAIKEGKGSLRGSYIRIIKEKPVLLNFNLPKYSKSASLFSYDPVRTRDLLLNSNEIRSLIGQTEQKGFTIVPLKIYTQGNLIKVLAGLARGKQKYQKKQDLIKKQHELEIRKALQTRHKS